MMIDFSLIETIQTFKEGITREKEREINKSKKRNDDKLRCPIEVELRKNFVCKFNEICETPDAHKQILSA